jgi:apurinic endonuclease APN1
MLLFGVHTTVGDINFYRKYNIKCIQSKYYPDKKLDLKLYVHSCMAINLANSNNKYIVQSSINKVKPELKYCKEINASCVIHMGSGSIDTLIKSIRKLNPKTQLLLENSVGAGKQLGATLNEIQYVLKELYEYNNIGVCIDTQHLFAAGEYNLSKSKDVYRFFVDFDKIIGMDKLQLIHLNDSKVEFGKHVDRHEVLGKGYIWCKSLKSLDVFLDICNRLEINIISETPNCVHDLELLHKLEYI